MSTTPQHDVTGLHHVTCIAGDPQRNLDFYTGTLGMRLVKRSVNQDAPDTYHLFYADAEGHAGSDLTFFPWPELPPGRRGVGLTNEVALAVPLGLILPRRIGLPELAVVGLIASIGFTGALFFATASVGPGPTLSTLKMSALLTLLGAPAAIVAAAALRVGRFGR